MDSGDRCDWTRAVGNEEVVKAVDIKNWLIVYPAQKEAIAERFCSMAMDVGKRSGIRLSMPRTVALRDDRPDTYYNEIKKNLNEDVSKYFFITKDTKKKHVRWTNGSF